MSHQGARRVVEAQCPIRIGDPCTLCFPGATGPQDCGLVYLVMGDEELRAELAAKRRAVRHASLPPSGQ